MQLFSVDATIFLKENLNLFCPQNVENPTLKWPKQKNSCSKVWLIGQLYFKLGYFPLIRQESVWYYKVQSLGRRNRVKGHLLLIMASK